jgi:hypothetical protein
VFVVPRNEFAGSCLVASSRGSACPASFSGKAGKAVAKLRSAPDEPSEQRGLGEIAEIELARLGPVLRLVKDEVSAGKSIGDEPCREQRQEKDDEPKLIGLCALRSFERDG